jgi:hypothetical protein
MTHKLDSDDFFIHSIQRLCAEAGLNFFLIEPLWVESFFLQLQLGNVWPRVLLNMHSEHHQPNEIYHRLVRLAARRNTRVIDPPETALAAFDKARVHPRLLSAGLHLPYTVIVPADQIASFRLSEAQRGELGSPFVVKPSLGYGRKGVIMDAVSEGDLKRSAADWPDPNYLLQRRIVPRSLGACPAYYRVFYVFGSTWVSWWNCFTDNYRLTTAQEFKEFALQPLEDIIRRVAALTGMTFFSSEIAQVESGEYVLIDYVNDQCHMLSQTANPKIGVPDELVLAIARRLVEAVKQMIGR